MATTSPNNPLGPEYNTDRIAILAEAFHEAWHVAMERGWEGQEPKLTRHLLAIFILGRAQEIGFHAEILLKDAKSFLAENYRLSAIRAIDSATDRS